MTDTLREFIKTVLSEVNETIKIKAVVRGPGHQTKTSVWMGDVEKIRVGLIMADVPKEERELILTGQKTISKRILAVLKQRDAVFQEPNPAPKPRDPNAPKPNRIGGRMSQHSAQEKLNRLIASFSKQYTDFVWEEPDMNPEDVCYDIADSFFSYVDQNIWKKYASICGMSRTTIKEIVADNVHDAMMKGAAKKRK
jgi:hypothetical protein